MADDPLVFGVDLESIRARIDLMGYFLSVTDALEAAEAFDDTLPASPPAAFVAVSREDADENKAIGGHSQRVRVEVAILFVEATARFDRKGKERVERTRKALIRQLTAWTPEGADSGVAGALRYRRYRIVKIGDGMAWGEVTFSTSYRLTI